MSDADFDDLKALWIESNQQSELQALEIRVRNRAKRARRMLFVEFIGAGATALLILALMAFFPQPAVILPGAMALLFIAWKIRASVILHRAARKPATGDAATIIDAAIRQTETAVKQLRLGLFTVVPSALLGAFIGQALVWSAPARTFENTVFDTNGAAIAAIGLAALVAIAAFGFFILKRREHELSGLRRMREEMISDETEKF